MIENNYSSNGLVPIPCRQIRAVYDKKTIRVYQAFSNEIADAALEAQRFVSPSFNMNRMTWIKPSFLWMMYRSGWASKDAGQQRVIAIDITRSGFDWALQNSIESHYSKSCGLTFDDWRRKIKSSDVVIQWDPERDIKFTPLPHRSIQIGLRNKALFLYINEWIRSISDITEFVHEMRNKVISGEDVCEFLPIEYPYSWIY